MAKEKFDIIDNIVLKGMLEPSGMPNFGSRLSASDLENLKKYIVASAKQIKLIDTALLPLLPAGVPPAIYDLRIICRYFLKIQASEKVSIT